MAYKPAFHAYSAILDSFFYIYSAIVDSLVIAVFFKENVRNSIWICRDPISLILGTRFYLILGTRFEILGTQIGSLKSLKKTLVIVSFLLEKHYIQQHYRWLTS